MKDQTAELIAQIIDLTIIRLNYNQDKFYVSVSTYDCGGTWQVWLDYGKSGSKPTHEVLIDNTAHFEARTLRSTLKRVLKELKRKDSSISLR